MNQSNTDELPPVPEMFGLPPIPDADVLTDTTIDDHNCGQWFTLQTLILYALEARKRGTTRAMVTDEIVKKVCMSYAVRTGQRMDIQSMRAALVEAFSDYK